MPHRWSGWPGAWCLDCGVEDVTEIAIADGLTLKEIKSLVVPPCPCPNSHDHDPYYYKSGELKQ